MSSFSGLLPISDNEEITVILIKPDAHRRGIAEELAKQVTEDMGPFRCSARVVVHDHDRELIEDHYAEHKGKPYYEPLVEFTLSGCVTLMTFTGSNVVSRGRKVLDRIREEYGNKTVKRENCIHASDSPEAGLREYNLWKKFIEKNSN